MKKIVFGSVFFGLLLTLMSFTNSKSNSFCPGPELPSSITFSQSCNISVTIAYSQGAFVSGVWLHNLSTNNISWIQNPNFGNSSMTLQVQYDRDYQVSLDYPICSGPSWAYFSTYLPRPAGCNMGDIQPCIPCMLEGPM